jgi:hypothetical protein
MKCIKCNRDSGLSSYCDEHRPGNPTQTGLRREDHSWDIGNEYGNADAGRDEPTIENNSPSDYGGRSNSGGGGGSFSGSF